MMVFHHRKFIKSQKYEADDCYLCYVCPENCYLSPPPPPQQQQFSDSKNHVPTILILMLCVLGVAFLVLSYLTLARYRRQRDPEPLEASRTNFIDENQGPVVDHPIWYIRTVGLPESVINAIASFTYRKTDGVIDGNDCAVCLNDFHDGEMLRLLPKCSHAFHVHCIDTWLRSHKNCPICRAPVLAADAGNARARPTPVESGSSSSGSGRVVSPDPNSEVEGSGLELASKNATSLDSDVLQPVRRSVSMDFSNSSIYRAMRGSSMKRSFSFSGKRSSGKNGRSSESFQLMSEIDQPNHDR